MKLKLNQTFIVQQISTGKLLHLNVVETSKKTVVFKNLDVPNGRKYRYLKKEFTNLFNIIEQ